jgi:glycosyltransferase involved in cell wall biosynthesis
MDSKYNLLYISTLCSKDTFRFIVDNSNNKSGDAIQKFHYLILKGLSDNETINEISTLTSIPVAPNSHKKRIWNLPNEQEDRIRYKYIPIINLPLLKNLIVFFLSFSRVLFIKSSKNNEKNIIICDVLSLSNSLGAFCASKLRGIKSIAILTDMPGLDVMETSIVKSIKTKLISYILTHYDGFVFITKQMNSVINLNKKPYIVMEGSVDTNMATFENNPENKYKEKVILYSGGIYERYGIKSLIDAFIKIDDSNLRLHIYGSGPMEKDMPSFMSIDNRIEYKGVVPNEIVVLAQVRATLLVNPRPTTEEFTKYSFPSKNMEYMVSGTPLVTTKLPGMPESYFPYVYFLNGESSDLMMKTLNDLIHLPSEELHEFGLKSKNFVLKNKNNIAQASKIVDLISCVIQKKSIP